MSDLELHIPFEEFPVAPGAWKTAASITPGTNQIVRPKSIRLYGDGISGNAKPIKMRFVRLDPGGAAGTATTITARKSNPDIPIAPRLTAKVLYTDEPDFIANSDGSLTAFHPQGGHADNFHLDGLLATPDSPLALQFFANSGETAIKISGTIVCEE